jgi:hypothetical protein
MNHGISRHWAEELADLLTTIEGERTARLLQVAGLLATPPPAAVPPAAAPPPPRGLPEPISIWAPREDGTWVRPAPSPFGDHYATRRVLARKTAELPLRVAFFGESVAAGYLYAPHLTPAQVLEGQLRAALGRDDFEVIDLARTNETLPTLAATVRASLQIQPDMLVLFVGNNWNLLETPEVSPLAPSMLGRQRFAAALREGLDAPLRLAEEELRRTAEGTFERIALIAGAVGIPVVVVVPEVNLADWETRQPVVALPGEQVAEWHRLYQEALDGEPDEAIRIADRMKSLDGGRCPTTWRLLARARLALGDREGAREACLAEVDSARYPTLAFLSAPQANTQARELLRELSSRYRGQGFVCVDLREVFAEHTGSVLPGRRLFLDYCHLTKEGIQVAMAAVAAEVLRLSGMTETDEDWRSLLARLPEPTITPEAEATARLGAAVHSAHRLLSVGPKQEILEYWCRAALDASPGVESAMLDLLDARSAPGPAVLTAAQQRNLASPYRLLLQHGWRWDHLDADLIEVLLRVLQRPVPHALLENHWVRPEGIDLADPFYHWEPLERFYPEVMDLEDLPKRGTFRSPWPESSFCLIVGRPRKVRIELIARLPEEREGEIEPAVNGTALRPFFVESGWTRNLFDIPPSLLHPGLNRLTLRWPLPELEDDPFERAIERLEIGTAANLHPVFGEVFSLVAR